MLYSFYIIALIVIIILGGMTLVATWKNPSAYGRHMPGDTQNVIDARRGWLIFEAPQWFAFALTFLLTARPDNHNAAAWLLFALWQGHYLYRAIAMPLMMRNQGKYIPMQHVWFGLIFNALNGFANGYAVGHAHHLTSNTWLSDPHFLIGLSIVAVGWVMNVNSDWKLFRLRAPGETGYKIPEGGMFNYVSCANYTGEILLWTGWAIMSWTVAGMVFMLFTLANLAPRAVSHHEWYRAKFPDYPKDRKAFIPWVL